MSEPKIPTAYSLTDRILSGLLVHGFENDADIETVLRQHVPMIEAVLVPVVAAAKGNADRIAALEAENARLRGIINGCQWYWPEGETTEDYCRFDLWDAVDGEPSGEVLCVERGGIVETIYCAWLPAADDADTDDEWQFEAPTREAVEAALKAEIERRAALTPEPGAPDD